MPSQTYHTIVVTGINPGVGDAEICQAHTRAMEVFDADLVSALSSVGHNFGQSFCVFPSWSGSGREGQIKHENGMRTLRDWLAKTDLDFVETKWTDGAEPTIISSHDSPARVSVTKAVENNEAWIEWHGGDIPVESDTPVEIRFPDGNTQSRSHAGNVRWAHWGDNGDVTAYRVVISS